MFVIVMDLIGIVTVLDFLVKKLFLVVVAEQKIWMIVNVFVNLS